MQAVLVVTTFLVITVSNSGGKWRIAMLPGDEFHCLLKLKTIWLPAVAKFGVLCRSRNVGRSSSTKPEMP
jgi:hypothetical protein